MFFSHWILNSEKLLLYMFSGNPFQTTKPSPMTINELRAQNNPQTTLTGATENVIPSSNSMPLSSTLFTNASYWNPNNVSPSRNPFLWSLLTVALVQLLFIVTISEIEDYSYVIRETVWIRPLSSKTLLSHISWNITNSELYTIKMSHALMLCV